jgi:hypothetical protein
MGSARQKLNGAFFTGSVLLAALLGAATQSWLMFISTLAVFVGLNLCLGEIRLRKPKR